MLKRHFTQIWDQLRSKKPQLQNFLEEVRIQDLRGIRELSVRLTYPVSVLAGPNACGKSTILFALACAYKVPRSGVKDFVPSTMFPDFRTRDVSLPKDQPHNTILEFYYIDHGQRRPMRWHRGKSWNRSFLGQKRGQQPERLVYLRTLSNLSNPSEVRSVLQLGLREGLRSEEITADQLSFAYRILNFRYRRLILMSRKQKDLLFAEREDEQSSTYSEFHMSAGEQAILRLSKDISALEDALVLIDEVEAGLHPFTQEMLMLELQRLALRNDLQIIVTTHSPVILNTVPLEARVFLERSHSNVEVLRPYHDFIQKVLYGRSLEKLWILCEDEVSEALLRGVFDILNPKLNLSPSDIEVGRNTGKEEFPQHIRALAKFQQLDDCVFVLDGDARAAEAEIRQVAQEYGRSILICFLPDKGIPESWIWNRFKEHSSEYANEFGVSEESFKQLMNDFERSFLSAVDKPANIAKGQLKTLAGALKREMTDVCRITGRREAQRGKDFDLNEFMNCLEKAIAGWRSAKE